MLHTRTEAIESEELHDKVKENSVFPDFIIKECCPEKIIGFYIICSNDSRIFYYYSYNPSINSKTFEKNLL